MTNLQDAFSRLQQLKSKLRGRRRMLKDELNGSTALAAVDADIEALRVKRKQIVAAINESNASVLNDIDSLKLEIKDQEELVSSIALTNYVKGETITIEGEEGIIYEPIVKVNYKKV
jgi:hypothetical protein